MFRNVHKENICYSFLMFHYPNLSILLLCCSLGFFKLHRIVGNFYSR